MNALVAAARTAWRWLTGADLPERDQARLAAWTQAARITGGDPAATALLAEEIYANLPTPRVPDDAAIHAADLLALPLMDRAAYGDIAAVRRDIDALTDQERHALTHALTIRGAALTRTIDDVIQIQQRRQQQQGQS